MPVLFKTAVLSFLDIDDPMGGECGVMRGLEMGLGFIDPGRMGSKKRLLGLTALNGLTISSSSPRNSGGLDTERSPSSSALWRLLALLPSVMLSIELALISRGISVTEPRISGSSSIVPNTGRFGSCGGSRATGLVVVAASSDSVAGAGVTAILGDEIGDMRCWTADAMPRATGDAGALVENDGVDGLLEMGDRVTVLASRRIRLPKAAVEADTITVGFFRSGRDLMPSTFFSGSLSFGFWPGLTYRSRTLVAISSNCFSIVGFSIISSIVSLIAPVSMPVNPSRGMSRLSWAVS